MWNFKRSFLLYPCYNARVCLNHPLCFFLIHIQDRKQIHIYGKHYGDSVILFLERCAAERGFWLLKQWLMEPWRYCLLCDSLMLCSCLGFSNTESARTQLRNVNSKSRASKGSTRAYFSAGLIQNCWVVCCVPTLAIEICHFSRPVSCSRNFKQRCTVISPPCPISLT